jgi:hypothetical protein
MADWIDNYPFPGQIGLNDVAHWFPNARLNGVSLRKILEDNSVKEALDIAEDDRRVEWPTGSKSSMKY